eukprot:1195326-Prorocentrum_minimum.AAC.9
MVTYRGCLRETDTFHFTLAQQNKLSNEEVCTCIAPLNSTFTSEAADASAAYLLFQAFNDVSFTAVPTSCSCQFGSLAPGYVTVRTNSDNTRKRTYRDGRVDLALGTLRF